MSFPCSAWLWTELSKCFALTQNFQAVTWSAMLLRAEPELHTALTSNESLEQNKAWEIIESQADGDVHVWVSSPSRGFHSMFLQIALMNLLFLVLCITISQCYIVAKYLARKTIRYVTKYWMNHNVFSVYGTRIYKACTVIDSSITRAEHIYAH